MFGAIYRFVSHSLSQIDSNPLWLEWDPAFDLFEIDQGVSNSVLLVNMTVRERTGYSSSNILEVFFDFRGVFINNPTLCTPQALSVLIIVI